MDFVVGECGCAEIPWFVAKTLDHGISKVFRAEALAGHHFTVEIRRVQTFFERAQPGVANGQRDIALPGVHKHHNSRLQEPGGVGDILARDVGSGSVNGLKHGGVESNVGRACEAHRAGHKRGNVAHNVAVEIERHHHIQVLRARRDQGPHRYR